MSTTFQRMTEDFTCDNCGSAVTGTGYTNHCPQCLWSKHVDVHPGDRAENCQGLMKPVGVDHQGDEYTLIHQCQKCGIQKRNKVVPADDFNAVLWVAEQRQP